MKRKYKVFDYVWHIPHQYDMSNALRNECEFYFCLNTKRQWDKVLRPLPDNIHFVPYYEEGKYDFAILHIDQEVVKFGYQKHSIFKEFNQIIQDIPKVIINHGSPVFPELFHNMDMQMGEKEMQDNIIEAVRSLVKDNIMVVNSFTAASEKEWGFGHPIVHGMNPNDWNDLLKEPRVFTALSPGGFDKYYNRECMYLVHEELKKNYGYILKYAKKNKKFTSPEEYKNYLGKSLLYLDTSTRTPMNRARTEAFLSGCCVIQVEGAHDLERWAKHGENIILVPDSPPEIAKIVVDFLENKYEEAITIGQKGKEMAKKEFNLERYRNNWLALIKQLLKEN